MINWGNRHRIFVTFGAVVWLFCACLCGPAQAEQTEKNISSHEAYAILKKKGELRFVTITDEFNLSKIRSSPKDNKTKRRTVTFDGVTFDAPVIANKTISVNLVFYKCHFQNIYIKKNTNWLGSVKFEENKIKNAFFQQNIFHDIVKFYFVTFDGSAIFNKSLFDNETDFLGCIFKAKASFSDTVFNKTARFIQSVFEGEIVKFKSSIFQDDVSFVEARTNGAALFENVMFKGDAEFRLMVMQSADFGDASNMTVFSKMADFRSIVIKDKANFNYVQFKQGASFVNAKFGEGGLSFRNASFRGELTNLEGLKCAGPLQLNGADIHAMNFYWQDIGEAILRAGNKVRQNSHLNPEQKGTQDSDHDPRIPVLERLLRRLKELARPDEILQVQYHISKLKMEETLKDPNKSLWDKVWPGFEWLFWGWPTGYGTEPKKIALISLFCLVMFAFPIIFRKGLLVLVPPGNEVHEGGKGRKEQGPPGRQYDPLYQNRLPQGAQSPLSIMERIRAAFSFTFALMFKIRLRSVRYLEQKEVVRENFFHTYFIFLWLFGSILLALLAVTVANTSPILKEVFGKIIF